ncbi:DUF2142 domain-containing protein [Candidatus Saccharibacteria bacterium]|nr:DUF2142 domain-containing protein [Candidatus Saccharibacteria bacterium]
MKEKVKKWLKTPDFYFYVVFVILSLAFTQLIIEKNDRLNLAIPILLTVFVVEVLMLYLLVRVRRKGWPLEKMFLLVATVLGIMFIILLPPGQAPDDGAHFSRAYGVADGVILAYPVTENENYSGVGSSLPEEVHVMLTTDNVRGTYKQKLKWALQGSSGNVKDTVYNGSALYSPLCYLPQVIGALIGRLFGMSVMGIAYLMEIFNFVAWLFLVYFGIKLLPKFKKMAILVALLPITLQEATSLSPDALTIGFAILLVGYVMNLAYARKGNLKKWDYILLAVIAIMIGMCKIVYVPLLLLYFTIPAERFGSKKRKWIALAVILGIAGIINFAWLLISSNTLLQSHIDSVDPKAQVKYILGAPIEYVGTMFRTVEWETTFWLHTMLGSTLGWLSIKLPDTIFYITFGIMLILIAQRDERLKIKVFDRVMYIASFVSILLLILTSLYLQWTPVGGDKVGGIQGRYFLPILALIPVMICRTNDKIPHMNLITENKIFCYGIVINMLAFVTFFVQNL